jgi:hypothetical protein
MGPKWNQIKLNRKTKMRSLHEGDTQSMVPQNCIIRELAVPVHHWMMRNSKICPQKSTASI